MGDQKYWNEYVKEYGYNPSFIKNVPMEFQTQEMWDSYVENGAFNVFGMKDIPYQFQTQEMWNKFLQEKGINNIKKVPVEFQSVEMWTKYLDKKDYFYTTVQEVPGEYQTQEMWNKSMEEIGYNPYFANNVPEKFLTIDILKNVIKNKEFHRQYDFHEYKSKLRHLEKIQEEQEKKKLAKSYIVNQERDYETGSRFAPYGNDEDYSYESLPTKQKMLVAKKIEPNLYGDRDYETGSRADNDLNYDGYEREM